MQPTIEGIVIHIHVARACDDMRNGYIRFFIRVDVGGLKDIASVENG